MCLAWLATEANAVACTHNVNKLTQTYSFLVSRVEGRHNREDWLTDSDMHSNLYENGPLRKFTWWQAGDELPRSPAGIWWRSPTAWTAWWAFARPAVPPAPLPTPSGCGAGGLGCTECTQGSNLGWARYIRVG